MRFAFLALRSSPTARSRSGPLFQDWNSSVVGT
jgi:hypothetical protein